jgi:hypothetical protein
MHFAACGAIMATIPITPALASPTSPSTFQQSCRNFRLAGATLTAECLRINRTYNTTAILIRGIYNNNGILTYTSNPTAASSYQSSCENIKLSFGNDSLEARCRESDGDYQNSKIKIRGISNSNGNLTYSR